MAKVHQKMRQNEISGYGGDPPKTRSLRVYSFDPSAAKELESSLINEVTIKVPWHDLRGPGPIREYVEVIDFDPASRCYYRPVNLDHPNILATDGLAPCEGNPQFHQQMVYAVVMATIGHFEQALGRAVLWARRVERDSSGNFVGESYVARLRIYPHAFRGANAYYSPKKKALLFGYFTATDEAPGQIVPGSSVFTCLSHDIIVHETTHAILDGMHPRFAERTNPDVLALHEGFADVVALFQHFTFPEVLEHQIAATRGDLSTKSLLVDLARQIGFATGRRGALRSAIGTPADPEILTRTRQVHKRGAILVAAVFDAFLAIYETRTNDLVRLATQGSGLLGGGQLLPDLVKRLADEAAETARHILHMCIRAMDYVPPVDVTFGDFLRALITADADVGTPERSWYRTALLESFRQRGIFPQGLNTVSSESLLWPRPREAGSCKDFPKLWLTLESATKRAQEDVEAGFARYQELQAAQVEVRDLLASREAKDISKMIRAADTPFDSVNQLLRSGSPLAALLNESQTQNDSTPPQDYSRNAFELPIAHFSLEWGIEGDRETKDFLGQQNCEQFYLTWVKHWAKENPHWAFEELGLVLFAAKHRSSNTNDYEIQELPHGIHFPRSDKPKALPRSIPSVEVHSFRVARRRGPRGSFLTELIVEITQRRRGYLDKQHQETIDDGTVKFDESDRGDFTLRGGCTLVIDPRNAGDLRYGIRRVIKNGTIWDVERLDDHRRFLSGDDGSLRASYFGMPSKEGADEAFAVLHSTVDT